MHDHGSKDGCKTFFRTLTHSSSGIMGWGISVTSDEPALEPQNMDISTSAYGSLVPDELCGRPVIIKMST